MFNRRCKWSKRHDSGCTALLYLELCTLSNAAHAHLPCAVATYKTCKVHQWNGYPNSVRIQLLSWLHINIFILANRPENYLLSAGQALWASSIYQIRNSNHKYMSDKPRYRFYWTININRWYSRLTVKLPLPLYWYCTTYT